MHFSQRAVALAALAAQALALPGQDVSRSHVKRSVDSFIDTESTIALHNLLCNIGADGCNAQGAVPGAVIASPSITNPDCTCFAAKLRSMLTA